MSFLSSTATFRQERRRKPDKPDDFVMYQDSDSEEETPQQLNEVLRTSYNFADYIRSRESDYPERRSICQSYATRHILTHDMFRETPITLGNVNKVFCSQWLGSSQVVFGTKCNKLMVYDVQTRRLDSIPTLSTGVQPNVPDSQHGIHAIELNPSKTLLATNARTSSNVAIYKLPTMDPIFLGTNAHREWIYDMCWLDDQFLVSGSKDTRLALWRIQDHAFDTVEDGSKGPSFKTMSAIAIKECRTAQKIRSICFNKQYKEIAVLSLNSYIHLFNAENFTQKLSRKLPNCQDNVCIACQPEGLYAVGCRSYTLLLDPRTLQAVKKIASRYSGCGIRSASFQDNILTVGTGLGMLMFYDIRAGKYLESSINSSRTVVLKASKGYVVSGLEFINAEDKFYLSDFPVSGRGDGWLPAN